MNLEQAMAGIKVGEPTVYGGLAVFPLMGGTNRKTGLPDAKRGVRPSGIEISEVSEGGSVPELRLKNKLDQDVFAADGETLLGAKQNRVLNSSIYVKASAEIVIPVSCVEQGRWSYQSRNFQVERVQRVRVVACGEDVLGGIFLEDDRYGSPFGPGRGVGSR